MYPEGMKSERPESGNAKAQEGGSEPSQASFEQAMAQVEGIVQRIESGEIGLEQSLAEYERGLALLRQCRSVLERVEQRITDLTSAMQAESKG